MFEGRPRLAIHLVIEVRFCQPGELAQQRIELWFDRADRNEVGTGAFIDAVEMRAAIQEIAVAPFGPATHRRHVEEHRHQRRRAIAHRGINHLTLPGLLRFQKSGEHADDKIKRTAAEIPDQIERRHRLFPGTDRGQRAGHRDIVDVVAGGLRQRTFLTPSGHPAVDQTRVARLHHLRPQPQSLHHPWTEAFDQRIGMAEELERAGDGSLVLQIELDDLASAPCYRVEIFPGADAIECHHFRAHIRQ